VTRYALMLGVVLTSCHPAKDPCTPDARNALIALYVEAANRVIDSGACDAYSEVSACPAYAVVEAHFTAAETALCQ